MPATISIFANGIIYDRNGAEKYDPADPYKKRVTWAIRRCSKPELHGRWWRVKIFGGPGEDADQYFPRDKESEAQSYCDAIRQVQGETRVRSLADAVTEYIEFLAVHGGTKGKPLRTARTTRRSMLEGILQLVDPELRRLNRGKRRPTTLEYRDRPLADMTPAMAQRLYDERVKAVKPDTHQSELIYARAFFQWCIDEKKWLEENPFAKVHPKGELSAGKDKLGLDQSERFLEVCFKDQHPFFGFAAAACLILNVRSDELLTRRVCDLDGHGTVLKIREYKSEFGDATVKSKKSVRDIKIPPQLQERFRALADAAHRGLLVPGQSGWNARLFGTTHKNTLLKHVKRLCRLAGVPEVCTHALRGSGADNAVETGYPLELVSRALGHAGTYVTTHNYVGTSSVASSDAARKADRLLSGVSPAPPTESTTLGTNDETASPVRPHLSIVK